MVNTPRLFKRAQRGLFAGKTIQFGKRHSFSHRRSLRSWKPNVQKKNFYSDLLQKKIKLNVTTAALRWIDRVGGFDNYLLYTTPKKINSTRGEKIRAEIVKAWEEKNKKEFKPKHIILAERITGAAALDLPKSGSSRVIKPPASPFVPQIVTFDPKRMKFTGSKAFQPQIKL